MINVNVKYHDSEMPRLRMGPRGDWIDVRASAVEVDGEQRAWQPMYAPPYEMDVVSYQAGQSVLIRLGFSMQFPEFLEAHVLPRSSLFKRTGLILVNSMGLIDHTYCGNGDEWLFPAYALRPGRIERFQRIAQFRLIERMPRVEFREVVALHGQDRGGYGSTDGGQRSEIRGQRSAGKDNFDYATAERMAREILDSHTAEGIIQRMRDKRMGKRWLEGVARKLRVQIDDDDGYQD